MDIRHLTDQELRTRLEALAGQERESVAEVVAHLAELDRRKSIADTRYGTIFVYCTKVLRYSEAAAQLRIRAARASRLYPRVLQDLRTGTLHLDALARLYPHLTEENNGQLLALASGASRRDVEILVAGVSTAPGPERDVVRIVSAPPPVEAMVIPPPSRVRLSFTADGRFLQNLDRLKSLSRHRFPEGRLEDILGEAVEVRLRAIDDSGSSRRPARPRTVGKKRWIPRAVRSAVWTRDEGRCAFRDEEGRRCECVDFIELDHIIPFAEGGPATVENLRLLCRAHNQRRAVWRFGPRRGGLRGGP